MQHRHLEYHNAAEQDHWWFAARREIVLDLVARRLSDAEPRELRLLDIGCGAGGMLNYLGEFGDAAGIDDSPEAVAFAREKTRSDVQLGALPDEIPFEEGEFDVITLLDVLEHIDDDVGSLERIGRLLRPGGFLVLTVPAYRFLWSEHDVVNEHKRRYTRGELGRKLRQLGFHVRKLSYFNTLLFPPIALVRLIQRIRPRPGLADEGHVSPRLNRVLRMVFAFEKPMLRWFSLPFGVSVIALADRPAQGELTNGA